MIWANVTKFGRNFIAPQNFLGWYAYAGEYGKWSIISHFSSAILASVIFATCGRALSWKNKSLNSYNRQARIINFLSVIFKALK